MATGANGVGSKWREREKEGKWINGVRDRALVRFRSGVGWKRPFGKRTPENFKQIRRIEQIRRQFNGILIILGWSRILRTLCCDFCSLGDASHHSSD